MIITPDRQSHMLNTQQNRAARYGLASGARDLSTESADGKHKPVLCGPLLVLAGAGTGKTTTIAHRVANLLQSGAAVERIMLMTFSRRAAREMTERAMRVVNSTTNTDSSTRQALHKFQWAGTYHSIANKLLRRYSRHIGLQPEFSILDRSDAADMMDVCRQQLKFDTDKKRFPRKDVCLDIYSQCTNRQQTLKQVVTRDFPWCESWREQLSALFKSYVALKQKTLSLDYDDLLLYWYHMMQESWLAEEVGKLFDYVLVDEYQDTNVLQASILKALKPSGSGVTVVGDDAQSIYSFRAAEVENIRDFPQQYSAHVEVVNLEHNYRSHQAILNFSNALMNDEQTIYSRTLISSRQQGEKPSFVTVEDEQCQAQYVAEQVLRSREDGLTLKQQAVLFRNSHHSDALEIELSRRNIPFVKYGGLKFLESHHVKDVLCLLRWATNSKDQLAAQRCMQLLPGIGPSLANKAWQFFQQHNNQFTVLGEFQVPQTKRPEWLQLCELMRQCASSEEQLCADINNVVQWYKVHLERKFSDAHVRWPDLLQLQQIASSYRDAESFLAELTLDPPSATGDLAGDPLKDEDFLNLSTVHSAKGQEWSNVFILNVVDGSFPSEFATGDDKLIEEERRLLYVAATRAKDTLHLLSPLKFYVPQQRKLGHKHVYGAQSRFMTGPILSTCERRFFGQTQAANPIAEAVASLDLPSRMADLW